MRVGGTFFSELRSHSPLRCLYCVMLEVGVYVVTCYSGFRPLADDLWCASVSICGDQIKCQPREYASQPHLGQDHTLYQLSLEVTRFGRRPCTQASQSKQVDEWLPRLDRLAPECDAVYDTGANIKCASRTQRVLHTLALQIICLKVKDPALQSDDRDIVSKICHAQRVLVEADVPRTCVTSTTWFLTVFLCACADLSTFQFFVCQVDRFEPTIGQCFRRDLRSVVSGLRHTYSASGNGSPVNNLRRLLCEKGIIACLLTCPDQA